MTAPTATQPRAQPADTGPDAELELYAGQHAVRRARGFCVFLAVNWMVMGWYVLRTPNSLVSAMAFGLGLLCLLGALGQLRGMRNARELPLILFEGDLLHHRNFTAGQARSVAFSELLPELEHDRSHLQVKKRDGDTVDLPWLALDASDRERLRLALTARLST